MGQLEKFCLTLRSLAFYIGYVSTGMLQGTLCIFIPKLLPRKIGYSYITLWNRFVVWWLNVTCGTKVEVEGLENIPQTPCVVLSKHQSPWETMYLLPRFNPLTVILKRELTKIPFFGWGLQSLKPIAIDRGNPKKALKQVMDIGLERLKDGYSVLVFPEGTRIDPGKTGKYARSGSNLAIKANVPAIFVAHNAGYAWPAHQFIKHPGVIKIKFSKPVLPEDHTSKSLIDAAEKWIEKEVAEMGGCRNSPARQSSPAVTE